MLKKAVAAAMIAALSLVAVPASALDPDDCPPPPPPPPASSPPPIPEGGVNCVFISTDHYGNGSWECETVMDMVTP